MAEKFLKFDDTLKALKEQEATTTSSGASDAGKIVALATGGKLDPSLFPAGIGQEVYVFPAYENLNAGDFVNKFNDNGVAKVRKADATSISKQAWGFVLEAVSAGSNATVYKRGANTQLSGLTPAAEYFLSTVAGQVTDTPPTQAGYIKQKLGDAQDESTLIVDIEPPMIRG